MMSWTCHKIEKTTTKNIVKWHVHTYKLIHTHSIPISQNVKKKGKLSTLD
jgi:hypothetical protein